MRFLTAHAAVPVVYDETGTTVPLGIHGATLVTGPAPARTALLRYLTGVHEPYTTIVDATGHLTSSQVPAQDAAHALEAVYLELPQAYGIRQPERTVTLVDGYESLSARDRRRVDALLVARSQVYVAAPDGAIPVHVQRAVRDVCVATSAGAAALHRDGNVHAFTYPAGA